MDVIRSALRFVCRLVKCDRLTLLKEVSALEEDLARESHNARLMRLDRESARVDRDRWRERAAMLKCLFEAAGGRVLLALPSEHLERPGPFAIEVDLAHKGTDALRQRTDRACAS